MQLVSEMKNTGRVGGDFSFVKYLLTAAASFFEAEKAVIVEGSSSFSWKPSTKIYDVSETIAAPLTSSELWMDVIGNVKKICIRDTDRLEETEPELCYLLKRNRTFSICGISFMNNSGTRIYLYVCNAEKHCDDFGAFLFFALFTKFCLENNHFTEKIDEVSTFLELFPGAVFSVSLTDRKLIHSNNRFYEMVGYDRQQLEEELEGDLSRIVYPDDRGQLEESTIKLEKEEKNSSMLIFRICRRDGTIRWVQCCYVISDKGPESVIDLIAFDITDQKSAEEELRKREEYFCVALMQIGANVWEYDIPTKTLHQTDVSQSLNDLPRIVPGIPESLIEIGYIHPDSADEFRRLVKSVEDGIQDAEGTYKVRRRNGVFRWQKTRCKLIYVENNVPKRAVILGEDITDMMEQKERYQHELLYRDSISQALIASYQVNLTRDEVENSRSIEGGQWENEGYQTYEQLIRKEGTRTTGDEERRKLMDALAYGRLLKQFTEGESTVTYEYQRIDYEGRVIWVRTTVNMVREPDSGDIIGFIYIRDIDQRKKRELTLAERAKRDKLTGLYNKNTVEGMIRDVLGKQEQDHARCALILINLDNFSEINHVLGYSYGDKILNDLARIIRSSFDLDAVLGRVDGDEFMVFIQNILSEDNVIESIQFLCRQINMTFKAGEDMIHISGSVGVSFSDLAEADYDRLYRQAELAVNETKRNGKNGYFVYNENLELKELKNKYLKKDGSKEQMLDELDFCVFVLNPVTGEVLFRNEYIRLHCSAQSRELLEKYCFSLIENQSGLQVPPAKTFTTRLSGRYVTRFKPILWNGLHTYLFLVYNTDTELFERFTSGEEEGECEGLFNVFCRLAEERDFSEVQKDILSYLGKYYNASRILLIEHSLVESKLKRAYEWHKEGVDDCLERLRNTEFRWVPGWNGNVQKPMPVLIEDMEQIRESRPQFYNLMKSEGVRSLYAQPAWCSDTSIIYLCVLDTEKRMEDIRSLTLLLPFLVREMLDDDREKRLTELIYKDSLTGTLNRGSYLEYERGFAADTISTLGVASVDINGLKKYNIQYGSNYGDQMILTTAKLLLEIFTSAKVFRMAADEFLVVEEDVSYGRFAREVEILKQRMNEAVANLASVGCVWEKQNINLEDQVRQADELMRITKQEYYHLAGEDFYKKETSMERNLRHDLETGYFHIYLQPKAEVESRKVVAAEALVRYVHPEKGVIAPGRFIAQLEQNGMIQYLDFFVFRQVCGLIQSWKQREMKPIKISTNFSRMTVLQNNLVPQLLEICREYQVSPQEIEIEVTETLGTMNQETLASISRSLRKAGFSISLDDFGSRFSSMSILSTMDFDVLKLDKSLIDNISNYKAKVMVEATLNFCKKAGIESIAEGVETEEQLETLKELGCERIQGYLLNKPLPVNVFERCYAESLR